jgi:hypothetical protein
MDICPTWTGWNRPIKTMASSIGAESVLGCEVVISVSVTLQLENISIFMAGWIKDT